MPPWILNAEKGDKRAGFRFNMVNSKENSNQTDRSSTTAKWFNPDTRWTLLFIGNRGKPITLKRFKGMVIFNLLVICVVFALAAGLFMWNRNILEEKNQLESNLNKTTRNKTGNCAMRRTFS